jgi:hypothetical protein
VIGEQEVSIPPEPNTTACWTNIRQYPPRAGHSVGLPPCYFFSLALVVTSDFPFKAYNACFYLSVSPCSVLRPVCLFFCLFCNIVFCRSFRDRHGLQTTISISDVLVRWTHPRALLPTFHFCLLFIYLPPIYFCSIFCSGIEILISDFPPR